MGMQRTTRFFFFVVLKDPEYHLLNKLLPPLKFCASHKPAFIKQTKEKIAMEMKGLT